MHPELVRKLTKPSKVASLFDWKKGNNCTVLILNFHKNRIGIAVAYHPSTVIPSPGGGAAPASCYELEPLRFDNNNKNQNSNNNNNNNNINNGTGTIRAVSIASRGAINQSCLNRFSDIIETYKVCGVIVSWPIQHDTGRMGAACGRVIYALEQLWEQSNGGNNNNNNHNNHNSNNNNNNNNNNNGVNGVNGGSSGGLLSRPFCLWDAAHIDLKQRTDPSRRVDVFGRCASYGFGSSSSTSKKDSSDEHSITSSSSSSSTATATATVPVPESNKNKNSNTRNNKYFAGKEQYHEDESTVVVGIWNDFCKEHWPTLTLPTVTATATATQRVTNFQEQQQQAQNSNNNNNNNKSNDNNNYPPENNDQESSLGYDARSVSVSPPIKQRITKGKKSLIQAMR